MRKIVVFISDVLSRVSIILVALTATLIAVSVLTACSSFSGGIQGIATEIDGFQTFAIVMDSPGNVVVREDNILIEATSTSHPKVSVYASTGDFKWSFFATPLKGLGDSVPISFSLDWGNGGFSVWANTITGWHYDYCLDNYLNSNGAPLEAFLTIGSKYNVEIELKTVPEAVIVDLLVANSTWNKRLSLDIALSPHRAIRFSVLSLQAWAGQNASALASYNQSKFTCYNLDRFAQQSTMTTLVLIFLTILLTVVTLFACKKNFSQFSSWIRLFCRQASKIALWSNLKRLAGRMMLYLRNNKEAFFLLLLFGGIRLAFNALSSGHTFDTYTFKVWTDIMVNRGFVAIYPVSETLPPFLGTRPVCPYPPLIPYILFILRGFLIQSTDDWLFTFLLKVPPIIADLALGWVVFVIVKNRKGYKAGLGALTLSLLNLINSSIWGQYDSIVALFMVLSVWFVLTNRIELGWVFAALSVATKQTALPYVPGLIVLSARKRRWASLLYGFAAFGLTMLIVWFPFLLNGFSFDFAMQGSGLDLLSPGGAFDPKAAEMSATTIWAFNIWPLVTLVKEGALGIHGEISDTNPNQFFGMSYYQLGLVCFVLFYVPILLSIRKASNYKAVLIRFSLLMLTFCMLLTRMHERYMIFSISFLPLLYGESRLITRSYLLLLTTYSYNLIFGLVGWWRPANPLSPLSLLTNVLFGGYSLVILISVNILIFLLLVYHCLKRWK